MTNHLQADCAGSIGKSVICLKNQNSCRDLIRTPNIHEALHVTRDSLCLHVANKNPHCVYVCLLRSTNLSIFLCLRDAVQLNVLATQKMLALARRMKHLQVFIHISTAYANCDRDLIEETIYPPPVDYRKLIDCLEYVSTSCVSFFRVYKEDLYGLSHALAWYSD